jgi:methylenetetrahydrofolate dehydrogenase (NADP+) / methenyltetrahydrofolate cyclohydrolase
MAEIISGSEISARLIEENLKPRVTALNEKGIDPKLVVMLVGDHVASASYVRQKEKSAQKAGILAETWRYEATVSEAEILCQIDRINADKSIHGVIVQLPLPDHISIDKILDRIDPEKDVDGFTPVNVGRLLLGQTGLECCTPKGIITMIESIYADLSGKNVVVIGRSNIVGKPVAALALNKNATVTVCHSRTKNLNEKLKDADIIIVAVGIPKFLKADQVPHGAMVIDVGIHKTEEGTLCGDVDFELIRSVAGYISPVPGGVGPMTVYSLIKNTVQAAESSSKKVS